MNLSVIFIILSALCRKLSQKMENRNLLKHVTKNAVLNTVLFFIKDTKNMFLVLASLFVGYAITTYSKMWGVAIDPFIYFAVWGVSHVVFSTIMEAVGMAKVMMKGEEKPTIPTSPPKERPRVQDQKNFRVKK